jgi:hypothetical protein
MLPNAYLGPHSGNCLLVFFLISTMRISVCCFRSKLIIPDISLLYFTLLYFTLLYVVLPSSTHLFTAGVEGFCDFS